MGLVCFAFNGASANPARAEAPAILLQTHDEEIGAEILHENPAVETIRCIAGRLGRRVEIRQAPRLRNKGLLAAGRIDGVFPNVPDPDLDGIAVATGPFVLERWSFIQPREARNPPRPRGHIVGTVLGSNEARFLTQSGLRVFDAIPNMDSLMKLLAAGRLPYVMVDDWSFHAEAARHGFPPDAFRSAIVKYVPLSAYFSKSFTEANPGFVSAFNETIKDCVNEGRKVALWEREILLKEAHALAARAGEAIRDRLIETRAVDGLDPMLPQILAFAGSDEKWRVALSEDHINPAMEGILGNPLSDLLRRVAAQHPLVTEIFVTNEAGFIVGLNRITSDFWQGDEDAAQAILAGGADRHFSDFEYDHSTRRFQVKLSMPIHDPVGSSAPIGMITIGLDAAGALAGSMH